MNKRALAGAGLVTVTLGAVGCGEPARPGALDPNALFPGGARRGPGLEGWRKYLEPAALHAAWVPPASSPWRPYYRPTLVAAVALVREAAGPPAAERDRWADAFGMGQDLADAAVFVDLPGEESVAWGVSLAERGLQPVLTFNNWPHQDGILRLERALGALLAYAVPMAALPRPASARPAFLLEGRRLSRKTVTPRTGEFDNRYFHSPTDFPAPGVLRGAGITRVFYVNGRGATPGSEEDDLNAYFLDLHAAGIRLTYAVQGADGGLLVRDGAPTQRATIFTKPATAAYASGGTAPYHRPYSHYHGFQSIWTRSSGTWGSGWSGGGGSSGWST